MKSTLTKFEEIVEELQRIKTEHKIYSLDDNMLFDKAVRIYNSIIISNSSKDLEKKDRQITPKQRVPLENLEYEENINIAKRQATNLINNYLDRQQSKRVL